MNQELPKPMLDALARQAAPGAHPSPAALTAFVEHTLTGGENQQVTDHLARCADCREVVFLASSAAEEPVAEEQDWMAVAGVPRISPALMAKAHAPQAIASASPAEAPRRKWTPRMVWALPVAAALLVVAGFLIQQRFVAVRSAPQLESKVASYPPVSPAAEPMQQTASNLAAEPAATKPAGEMRTKTARAKSVPSKSYDAVGLLTQPSTVVLERAPAPAISPHNETQKPAAIVIGGPSPAVAPAAPHFNSFAAGAAERAPAEPGATGQLSLAPQPLTRNVRAMHPQWRVTAEGHLEHYLSAGWTRVLADQTTAFRVVSIVGDDVWAGGTAGVLFHSSDGGKQWGRISVVTSSGTLTATIVSIHFDDPQNGVLVTESGSRCSTGDGGLTWTSQ